MLMLAISDSLTSDAATTNIYDYLCHYLRPERAPVRQLFLSPIILLHPASASPEYNILRSRRTIFRPHWLSLKTVVIRILIVDE